MRILTVFFLNLLIVSNEPSLAADERFTSQDVAIPILRSQLVNAIYTSNQETLTAFLSGESSDKRLQKILREPHPKPKKNHHEAQSDFQRKLDGYTAEKLVLDALRVVGIQGAILLFGNYQLYDTQPKDQQNSLFNKFAKEFSDVTLIQSAEFAASRQSPGYFYFLRYLRLEKGRQRSGQKITDQQFQSVMDYAFKLSCQKGLTDFSRWLVEHRAELGFTKRGITDGLNLSLLPSHQNQTKAVSDFMKMTEEYPDLFEPNRDVCSYYYQVAAYAKDCDFIQRLIQHPTWALPSKKIEDHVLKTLAFRGQFDEAKWFLTQKPGYRPQIPTEAMTQHARLLLEQYRFQDVEAFVRFYQEVSVVPEEVTDLCLKRLAKESRVDFYQFIKENPRFEQPSEMGLFEAARASYEEINLELFPVLLHDLSTQQIEALYHKVRSRFNIGNRIEPKLNTLLEEEFKKRGVNIPSLLDFLGIKFDPIVPLDAAKMITELKPEYTLLPDPDHGVSEHQN
ncbi:MAG: hypothetical protein KF798_03515 [Candidatus Paracaedibacteraceae bacterium]|nr:hypothetical protein [Candidatus Paracaedibacteraceae bacterium]